jgi:hypothetical protein
MEQDLIDLENGRQPQCFGKIEDVLNILAQGRSTQYSTNSGEKIPFSGLWQSSLRLCQLQMSVKNMQLILCSEFTIPRVDCILQKETPNVTLI